MINVIILVSVMVIWVLIAVEHFGTRGSLKRFLVMLWARYDFWIPSIGCCLDFMINFD